MIKTYKFSSINEIEYFLRGAILGGPVDNGGLDLVGKTLIFTAPTAVTVTFAALAPSSRNSFDLKFPDIKAQIEAAVTDMKVHSINGRILLVETTPTNGVTLAAAGTANRYFGFPTDAAVSGRVYADPYSAAAPLTPPYLIQMYATPDNSHVVVVSE